MLNYPEREIFDSLKLLPFTRKLRKLLYFVNQNRMAGFLCPQMKKMN
jgi:hypothetical protein